jgi:ribosomal protein L7Ae-like RNA K-turn-binding protein
MDKILSFIGLATKAGKTLSGEFSVENAIRDGKAKLVIVAGDASDNTKKKFRDKCAYYKVDIREYSDKSGLGSATGAQFRAVIALTDSGFAKSLLKKLDVEF